MSFHSLLSQWKVLGTFYGFICHFSSKLNLRAINVSFFHSIFPFHLPAYLMDRGKVLESAQKLSLPQTRFLYVLGPYKHEFLRHVHVCLFVFSAVSLFITVCGKVMFYVCYALFFFCAVHLWCKFIFFLSIDTHNVNEMKIQISREQSYENISWWRKDLKQTKSVWWE